MNIYIVLYVLTKVPLWSNCMSEADQYLVYENFYIQ